ncbi:T9SS type A sorting domain-containing protein [Flavobacterium sp.]|uniref:T9SS type A sorting domain-containing protein n=1 Tax=Flavobacterium sp. TaxID=239 RepID=UPI0035AFB87B
MDATTFVVVPNPSKDKFEILFQNELLEEATYEVYNLLGQKVKHDKLEDTKEYVLNLNEAANGTYLMKINNGSSEEIKRIIINRK